MEHIASPDSSIESTKEPTAVAAQISDTAVQVRTLLNSAQIDAAQGYGASYHPLTGEMLVGLRFDPAAGRFIRTSIQLGFGHTSTTVKTLDRIGDGADHALDELPLTHWKFDPRTGQPIKRLTALSS